MKRILVVDDDSETCKLLSKALARKGVNVDVSYNGDSCLQLLAKRPYDLLICDFRLGDMDGAELLLRIKKKLPSLQVIFITGYSDVKIAVKLIKMGAFDYITKPLDIDDLWKTAQKAFDATDKLRDMLGAEVKALIGESEPMQLVKKQIELVAPINYKVLLLGERGTGKELIAYTINKGSNRAEDKFVIVDCSAMQGEQAYKVFFGEESKSDPVTGYLESADGGTIYLEEVQCLPDELQAALVRVLQEQKIKRVGGNKDIPIDVRFIAGSSEDLVKAVKEGRFREDLYHKLSEFVINVPPLRSRLEDLELIIEYFLKRVNAELGKNIQRIEKKAKTALLNYSWPGNIRELKNVIRRAAIMTEGNSILYESLSPEVKEDNSYRANGHKQSVSLKEVAQEAEMAVILSVLKQVNYNRTKAAELLDIDRKTLYNKLKGLDL